MLMRFSGLVFGFSSLNSTLVSLRFSVAGGCCAPCCVVPLWSLRRSAPLVLFLESCGLPSPVSGPEVSASSRECGAEVSYIACTKPYKGAFSVTKIEKRKEQAKPTKPSAIPKSAVGRGVNLNLIFETE